MSENFVGNRPDAVLFQMSALASTPHQVKIKAGNVEVRPKNKKIYEKGKISDKMERASYNIKSIQTASCRVGKNQNKKRLEIFAKKKLPTLSRTTSRATT